MHGMVCRGPNPPEFDALGDVTRYCRDKGSSPAITAIVARRQPVYHQGRSGGLTPITLANVCSGLYGVSDYPVRGMVHWCSRTPSRLPSRRCSSPPTRISTTRRPSSSRRRSRNKSRSGSGQGADAAELKERLDRANQEQNARVEKFKDAKGAFNFALGYAEKASRFEKTGVKGKEFEDAIKAVRRAEGDLREAERRLDEISRWIDLVKNADEKGEYAVLQADLDF